MLATSANLHFAKNVKGHDHLAVYCGVSYARPEADGRPHPGWWIPAGKAPSSRNLCADGGAGDLVAVGTRDLPKLPGVNRIVVLAQHATYTHLGVIVSEDLPAPSTSEFNKYYRWVRVIARAELPHDESSALALSPVDVSKWPWFQPGGAYCEIGSAVPLGRPAVRRAWCDAVWAGFGLAGGVEVDATPVKLLLDATHIP